MTSVASAPSNSRWRVLGRVALGLFAVALASAGVALGTIDRWFFTLSDPGAFDPRAAPPAPDYAQPESWVALPEREDAADVALPSLPALADQTAAPAAVFYLHPTTWLGGSWNGPIDDPMVVEGAERGGALIQASVFNACCAVYGPRYRQAHGHAYVRPNAAGDAAIEVAYADVRAAFEVFLERIGDRPFILAGHSQGAVLGGRLLAEVIAGSPLEDRLVAAYLLGAPLRPDQAKVPVCASPTQTGCVVGWNARGPDYAVGGFELEGDDPDTMSQRICVNPLRWTPGGRVDASEHGGALFFDTPAPQVKGRFADAECRGGALVLTTLGDTERDLPSRLLLWMMGPDNYHPIEFQLFYVDLRQNARARVLAKLATLTPSLEASP